MQSFKRIILVSYLLIFWYSLGHAQTVETTPTATVQPAQPPQINLADLKTVNFNIASIPDTYFSKDLNDARTKIISGQTDEAAELINNNLKNTSKRSPLQKAYILEGYSYYQNSKYKEAVQSYNKYFKLNAANSDVLFLKGLAQAKLGDLAQALDTLNESVWFNKFTFVSPADVDLQISYIYSLAGDKAKASDSMKKALAAKSDDVGALVGYAEMLLDDGKKAEAVATVRTALVTDKDNEETKLLLAKALLKDANRVNNEKDILEAKSVSKEVLSATANPATLQAAAILYARANIENSKFDEASATINTYLKKFPSNTELQNLSKQLQIEIQSATTPAAG
jgi:tetratricopeptide (TPR) repeat protein